MVVPLANWDLQLPLQSHGYLDRNPTDTFQQRDSQLPQWAFNKGLMVWKGVLADGFDSALTFQLICLY